MTSGLRRHHDVAVGIIVADDGRLLLQHRDDKPGIPAPGAWGLFGGHVEPDERVADAFRREMAEELGWRPSHLEMYLQREIRALDAGKDDDWHITSHVFAAHLDVPLTALTLGEGQALRLFDPASLPVPLTPDLAAVIATFVASDAYKRVKHRWDIITSTGILVDGDGRFLLQHRDDKPGIDNPGMWGSFGGRVEPYETPDDGFVRELQEELSWQPRSFELFAGVPYRPDDRNQLIYIYAAPVEVAIDALVLGEGQGMAFAAPDALPAATQADYRTLLQRFAATEMYREMTRRAREP